jgi:hypothetical protein
MTLYKVVVVIDVLSLERTIEDLAMQRQWSALCLSGTRTLQTHT